MRDTMQILTVSKTLKAALLAALVAAFLVSVFHSIVTEPVIDQAIGIEEQMSHEETGAVGNDHHEEPIISRDVQKWGLFLGWGLYALSWASLFGAIYFLAQNWLPGTNAWQRGLLMAGLAYWGIVLLPFLKYPANPPGVGDPATIEYRQILYLSLLALSIVGGVGAILVHRQFESRSAGMRSWLPPILFIGIFSLAVYLLMPNNPDPIRMPMEVVQNFRALSISGLTIFWLTFGFCFAWLAKKFATDTTFTTRQA
jgi:predicted cobalt transporter CbtA